MPAGTGVSAVARACTFRCHGRLASDRFVDEWRLVQTASHRNKRWSENHHGSTTATVVVKNSPRQCPASRPRRSCRRVDFACRTCHKMRSDRRVVCVTKTNVQNGSSTTNNKTVLFTGRYVWLCDTVAYIFLASNLIIAMIGDDDVIMWHRHHLFNKKLSCRREIARCFVSLNILLSHSRSVKVIRNDTLEKGV